MAKDHVYTVSVTAIFVGVAAAIGVSRWWVAAIAVLLAIFLRSMLDYAGLSERAHEAARRERERLGASLGPDDIIDERYKEPDSSDQ